MLKTLPPPPQTGRKRLTVIGAVLLTAFACLLWLFQLTGLSFAEVLGRLHPARAVTRPMLPIRFVDVAARAGLDYRWKINNTGPHDILESIGDGCAFLDYDNDGNLDILLVGPKPALYRGDGHGHFTDVTRAMGLDKLKGHFLGCAVGDYDNDGYDDIYLSGWHTGLLLHNERGKGFKDVTRQVGLKPQPWGTCCAFGSFGPGPYLDLYVCNYVQFRQDQFETPGGPGDYHALAGVLYHNAGGRRFVDVTSAWGADKTTGRGLGAAFAPVDAGGRVGLAVANDVGLDDLFVSTGPGRLENIGKRSGHAVVPALASLNGRMGIDWGDYDNDGRLDLFVTTYEHEPKILLHNLGSDLFDNIGGTISHGAVGTNLSFGCKWLDADNSGWLDLMITNGHITNSDQRRPGDVSYRQPTLYLHSLRGHGFEEAADRVGLDRLPPVVGRGLAVGDFDNDGRMDALVVDSEGAPLLLHNETAPAGHWLSFTLEGTRSNRDGYGAVVTVTAGGPTQTRLCHADGSYLSSSDKRVHVGLGGATAAETVSVRWPSGRVDTFHGLRGDAAYRVREGDKEARPVAAPGTPAPAH